MSPTPNRAPWPVSSYRPPAHSEIPSTSSKSPRHPHSHTTRDPCPKIPVPAPLHLATHSTHTRSPYRPLPPCCQSPPHSPCASNSPRNSMCNTNTAPSRSDGNCSPPPRPQPHSSDSSIRRESKPPAHPWQSHRPQTSNSYPHRGLHAPFHRLCPHTPPADPPPRAQSPKWYSDFPLP